MALGASARTEAVAALVVRRSAATDPAHAWATIPELERDTGFHGRNLLDHLPDMARAGMLDHERNGRSHRFRARSEIAHLLTPVPAVWLDWSAHITMLLELEAAYDHLCEHQHAAGAMDALRLVTYRSDVVPERFEPHGDPSTLAARLEAWLLASARNIGSLESLT
jgi:hypothetical protein